jgi:hypothetical protein
MRKLLAIAMLTVVTFSAVAAIKESGTTTLKDFQPVGSADKKHKHQQYDMAFVVSTGKEYTCRTAETNR